MAQKMFVKVFSDRGTFEGVHRDLWRNFSDFTVEVGGFTITLPLEEIQCIKMLPEASSPKLPETRDAIQLPLFGPGPVI